MRSFNSRRARIGLARPPHRHCAMLPPAVPLQKSGRRANARTIPSRSLRLKYSSSSGSLGPEDSSSSPRIVLLAPSLSTTEATNTCLVSSPLRQAHSSSKKAFEEN